MQQVLITNARQRDAPTLTPRISYSITKYLFLTVFQRAASARDCSGGPKKILKPAPKPFACFNSAALLTVHKRGAMRPQLLLAKTNDN